jgi:hypothetical protein
MSLDVYLRGSDLKIGDRDTGIYVSIPKVEVPELVNAIMRKAEIELAVVTSPVSAAAPSDVVFTLQLRKVPTRG